MDRSKSNFPPIVLYENRYCNQDDFSILICGGRNEHNKPVKSIFQLYGSRIKCKNYTYLPKGLYNCKSAVINSELYVSGGYSQDDKFDYSVRKFCKNTKTWTHETQLDVKYERCYICSFKQNLYVFESIFYYERCLTYNIKNDKWSNIANMNDIRQNPACTVFEGKIVVSGGRSKSVEAYDYYENKWTYLPDMIKNEMNMLQLAWVTNFL